EAVEHVDPLGPGTHIEECPDSSLNDDGDLGDHDGASERGRRARPEGAEDQSPDPDGGEIEAESHPQPPVQREQIQRSEAYALVSYRRGLCVSHIRGSP